MIRGIHHVALKCNTPEDFNKAKEFYLEVLGLPLRREWDGGLMVETGNGLIEIFSDEPGVKELGAVNHYALDADDVDMIIERVKEAGYEVFREPEDIVIESTPKLPARIAFCYGPLGEEIEFFCEK